jgi:phasin family protein
MSDVRDDIVSAAVPRARGVRRKGEAAVLPGLPGAPVASEAVLEAVAHEPVATPAIEPIAAEQPAEAAPEPVSAEPAPLSTTPAEPAEPQAEDISMDAVNAATTVAQDTADRARETMGAAAEGGRALFADWNARAKDAMEKGAKAMEDWNGFARGNVEAMVESSRIAVRGFEAMGQRAAELTRKSLDEATAATRTLSQVKSPTELMRLQGDYARSAFDSMVAEASRSTEALLKLAGEVAQPVANRVAVAADTFKAA